MKKRILLVLILIIGLIVVGKPLIASAEGPDDYHGYIPDDTQPEWDKEEIIEQEIHYNWPPPETTLPSPPPEVPPTTVPPTIVPPTTVPPTTVPPTTVPDESVFIAAVGPTCQKDVPSIRITFGDQMENAGDVGTLTFFDVNQNLIETRPITYLPNETVYELYPGAKVDPVTGEATDWPGWVQNVSGLWVEDPTDAVWRLGLTLFIDINPTYSTQVSYPPATSACANPPPNPIGPPPPIELPPTL